MPMSARLLRPRRKRSSSPPIPTNGLMLWLDAADDSTLFQNVGGTNPVTASGQSVLRWNDKSGNGRNALATRVVSSLSLVNGGSGYTTPPDVTITRHPTGDSTGTGATATATISGGVVTALTLTTRGNFYQVDPVVSFSGGGGTGATATAFYVQPPVRRTSPPSVEFNTGQGATRGPYMELSPRFSIPDNHTTFVVVSRSTLGQNYFGVGSAFDSPTISTHQGARYAPGLFGTSGERFYSQANANFTTHSVNGFVGNMVFGVTRVGGTSVTVRCNGLPADVVTTGTAVTQSASGTWGAIGADVTSLINSASGNQSIRPSRNAIYEVIIYDRALSDAENLAITTYLAAKWGITLYQLPTFADADVNNYITAVETADGQALESGVRNAINTFITGCKADGIWSAIKASCILMGTRTLPGALVPLAGTAPTNVNFVSADYNRKTGLAGNAVTKYLNSNRSNSADPQNSNHNAVYATQIGTTGTYMSVRGALGSDMGANALGFGPFFNSRAATASVYSSSSTGLIGHSRSSSSGFIVRFAGANQTATATADAALALNLFVFARNTNSTPEFLGDARLAFYSIGESVDLALLDSRVSALYSAIQLAIP